MITRELIVAALEEKGYSCRVNDVVKNSVVLPAINILTSTNISPTIYTDSLIERFDSLDDIVDEIIKIYETHKDFNIDVISLLSDKDWLLEHIFIALQRESDEPLIKKMCDGCFAGLEQYLFVRNKYDDEGWSVKLNTSILALAKVTIDEAWEYGKKNTFSPDEPIIQSLSSLLFDITGCSDFVDVPGMPPLFVLTNRCKTRGSIQVLNTDYINSFVSSLEEAKGERPVKLAILPSSLHEVLIYPIFQGDIFSSKDEEELTSLVQAVNQDSVEPVDVLSDHVFILEL